jgi:hypothetical protein
LTKRVIALAWAVDPLAFNVFVPPQVTGTGNAPAVGLPPAALIEPPPLLALLPLQHPDKISALVTKALSAAANRFGFNSVPSCRDETGSSVGMSGIAAVLAAPSNHLSQP